MHHFEDKYNLYKIYNISEIRDIYQIILAKSISDRRQSLSQLNYLMKELVPIAHNKENFYSKYIKMYLRTTSSLEHLQSFQSHFKLKEFDRIAKLNQLEKDNFLIDQYMVALNLGWEHCCIANAVCLDSENPHLLESYMLLSSIDLSVELKDVENCVLYHLRYKYGKIVPEIETVFYKGFEPKLDTKEREAKVNQKQLDMITEQLSGALEKSKEYEEDLYQLQGVRLNEKKDFMYFCNRNYNTNQMKSASELEGDGAKGFYDAFGVISKNNKEVAEVSSGSFGIGKRFANIVILSRDQILKYPIALSEDPESQVLPEYIRRAALNAILKIARYNNIFDPPLFENTSEEDFNHFHLSTSNESLKAKEEVSKFAQKKMYKLHQAYVEYDKCASGSIKYMNKDKKFELEKIKKTEIAPTLKEFRMAHDKILENFLIIDPKGCVIGTSGLEFQFHTYENPKYHPKGVDENSPLRRPRMLVSNPCKEIIFPPPPWDKKVGNIKDDQRRYITNKKDNSSYGHLGQIAFFFSKNPTVKNGYLINFRVGFSGTAYGLKSN